MLIHIHPDKRVIFKNEDEVLYNGSFDEAAQVLGQAVPPLPEGVQEIQFDTESDLLVGFSKKGQLDSVQYDMSLFAESADLFVIAGEEKKKALEEAATAPQVEESTAHAPVPGSLPSDKELEDGNAT